MNGPYFYKRYGKICGLLLLKEGIEIEINFILTLYPILPLIVVFTATHAHSDLN